jgi:hypothetical protein
MKLVVFFLVSLFLVQAAIAGEGNCQIGLVGEIKEKAQSILEVVGPGTDCLSALTSDEEHELLDTLQGINRDYFEGTENARQRNEAVEQLLRKLNSVDESQKEGVLGLLVAQQNEVAAGRYVSGVIYDFLDGKELSSRDKEVIAGLNIKYPGEYVRQVAASLAPYYENLKSSGAKFNRIKGWDISGVEMNAEKLKKDPGLYTSLAVLFSPQTASALSDSMRDQSVYIGNQVFMPPGRDNDKGRFPSGHIRVMDRDKHDREVSRELKSFSADTEEFIKASRETASYQNLMHGRILEFFGIERGDKGRTGPEINAETSYSRMMQTRERLKQLGVSREKISQIDEAIKYSNELERSNIERGIAKIELARKAAIAAPFIPLAMAAAPLAGGLYSPTMASMAANASATLAFMPMAFAAGSSLIHASIDSARQGNGFFCHLAEKFSEAGAGALYTAPFLASLPTAASLVSVTPLALGSATGSVALFKIGAMTAPLIYGGVNLGAALYFIKDMGGAGVVGAKECYGKIKKVHDLALEKKASSERLDNLATGALHDCADSGINLAFAISGGAKMAQSGYTGYKNIKIKMDSVRSQRAGNVQTPRLLLPAAQEPGALIPLRTSGVKPILPVPLARVGKPDVSGATKTTGFFTKASPDDQNALMEKFYSMKKTGAINAKLDSSKVFKINSDLPKDSQSALNKLFLNLEKSDPSSLQKLRSDGIERMGKLALVTSGAGLWTRGGGVVKALVPYNIAEILSSSEMKQLIEAGKDVDKFSGIIRGLVDKGVYSPTALNPLDMKLVNAALLSQKSKSYVSLDVWTSEQTHGPISKYLDWFNENFMSKTFHSDPVVDNKIKSAIQDYILQSKALKETHLFGRQNGYHAIDVKNQKFLPDSPHIGKGAGELLEVLKSTGRTDELKEMGKDTIAFENIEVQSEHDLLMGAHVSNKRPVSVVLVEQKEGYNGGNPFLVDKGDGNWNIELHEASALNETYKTGNDYFNSNTLYMNIDLPHPSEHGFEERTLGGIDIARPKLNAGDVTKMHPTAGIVGRIGIEYENFKRYDEFAINGARLIKNYQNYWASFY